MHLLITRIVALALTLLTGFSGLVYEVSWQRYLAILLGSHGEATAAILAVFLGGLAVGYSCFAGVTRRISARPGAGRRLLLVYGSAELLIGLHALVFGWLFGMAQTLSLRVPAQSAFGFPLDVLLVAGLIGPPTVLMGGTIPILTQALSRSLADATRIHSLVYGLNTLGAFAGASAAGFMLIPWLGLGGTIGAMGLVNLGAGSCFLALGLTSRAPGVPADAGLAGVPRGFWGFACVAGLAGLAMMSLQTVLIRLGGLSFGASQFTFSMVVAAFVASIALGSFAVSAFSRIRAGYVVGTQLGLAVLGLALYRPLADAAYWAHWLRTRFGSEYGDFYPYYLTAFAGVLAVLIVPVGLSGALLPLLFNALRERAEELGSLAGRLYSWNTVGSFLGALLGGYALYFWFDLHQVYRLSVALLVLSSGLLALLLLRGWQRPGVLVLCAALLAGLALQPAWPALRLASGLLRIREPLTYSNAGPDALFADLARQVAIRFYRDDPTTSVAVWESKIEPGLTRSIVTNGKSDGGYPLDRKTVILLALLPSLMARDCERSFVIGYGTGVTAGVLADLECSHEVEVAEISRGVIEAAPLFGYTGYTTPHHPKLRIVIGDAYRSLLRSEGRYDVITSEPSHPWGAGIEMLYAREFLEAAKSRLAPGGVFAQWIHTYETDHATLELVYRTLGSVFEHVAIWSSEGGHDLILLGLTEPAAALDLERLEARVARPAVAAALVDAGIDGLGALLAHELHPVDVVVAARTEGPIHTLLHPILGDRAARAFFSGGKGSPPPLRSPEADRVALANSLLGRLLEHSAPGPSDVLLAQVLREACYQNDALCVSLLARWRAEWPHGPGFEALQRDLRATPRGRTTLAQVDMVEPLMSEPPSGAPLSLDAAEGALRIWDEYWTPAAPLDPEALRALWRVCPRNSALSGRCRDGLAALDSRVGPPGSP